MAVLGLLVVVVFPLQTLLLLVVQAARALERHQEPLAALAVCPVLPVLTPLLEDCSGKVVVVAAAGLGVWAVLAAQEAVALVVAAVELAALHMPPAPGV